jgi:hypothetical protein
VEARAPLALGNLYGGHAWGGQCRSGARAGYPLGGGFISPMVSQPGPPEVLRFNCPRGGTLRQVARAWGRGNSPPLSLANAGCDRLAHLAQACGVPQRLSGVGCPAINSSMPKPRAVTRLLVATRGR